MYVYIYVYTCIPIYKYIGLYINVFVESILKKYTSVIGNCIDAVTRANRRTNMIG